MKATRLSNKLVSKKPLEWKIRSIPALRNLTSIIWSWLAWTKSLLNQNNWNVWKNNGCKLCFSGRLNNNLYIKFFQLVNWTSVFLTYISNLFPDKAWSQFVVSKPPSYCFEETIGFDVKASFAKPSVSRLIKPGDITKEFWEHGTFHGLKITTDQLKMLYSFLTNNWLFDLCPKITALILENRHWKLLSNCLIEKF